MTYEDFFDADEVAIYKQVKRGSMRIGRLAREAACELVGGSIPISGKQFVYTKKGVYRLAMSHNSDNTTEQHAHQAMGATTIAMGDEDEMRAWFEEHGVPGDFGMFRLKMKIRGRL